MDYKIGGVEPGIAASASEVVFAKSHGTLVAGQPVYVTMDSGGYLTKAIPNGEVGLVGVALHAAIIGDIVEVQVSGVCKVYDGDVGGAVAGDGISASNGSGYGLDTTSSYASNVGNQASTEFAVALETTAAAGLVKVLLCGYKTTSVA